MQTTCKHAVYVQNQTAFSNHDVKSKDTTSNARRILKYRHSQHMSVKRRLANQHQARTATKLTTTKPNDAIPTHSYHRVHICIHVNCHIPVYIYIYIYPCISVCNVYIYIYIYIYIWALTLPTNVSMAEPAATAPWAAVGGTQQIHEHYDRFMAGSVLSRSNPAIVIFNENRNFGHARLDFHENPSDFNWNLRKLIQIMWPILIFTHAIIKTMEVQFLVSSNTFTENSTSLNTRCVATILHQDHFRSSSIQKSNPYACVLARKISTVAVLNRFGEKTQFYGLPGMQIVERHWLPISPQHRITLQANRSTNHLALESRIQPRIFRYFREFAAQYFRYRPRWLPLRARWQPAPLLKQWLRRMYIYIYVYVYPCKSITPFSRDFICVFARSPLFLCISGLHSW